MFPLLSAVQSNDSFLSKQSGLFAHSQSGCCAIVDPLYKTAITNANANVYLFFISLFIVMNSHVFNVMFSEKATMFNWLKSPCCIPEFTNLFKLNIRKRLSHSDCL